VSKIKIIVIDKTKAPFLAEGEHFYLKRLRHYIRVEWIEARGRRVAAGSTRKEILDREAEAIIGHAGSRDHLIALSQEGVVMDSVALACKLEGLIGKKDPVTFVIGGPLGLGDAVYERSVATLSLSRFTLTHEMTRLILLEQLYRAFTIMRKEKYHK